MYAILRDILSETDVFEEVIAVTPIAFYLIRSIAVFQMVRINKTNNSRDESCFSCLMSI